LLLFAKHLFVAARTCGQGCSHRVVSARIQDHDEGRIADVKGWGFSANYPTLAETECVPARWPRSLLCISGSDEQMFGAE
jgi:hypothetical protein